jgi:hypothetical protein
MNLEICTVMTVLDVDLMSLLFRLVILEVLINVSEEPLASIISSETTINTSDITTRKEPRRLTCSLRLVRLEGNATFHGGV